VASPLLGINNQILLLVDNTVGGRYSASNFVQPHAADIGGVIFFGGTTSLPQTLRNTLLQAANVS
jgi:hypothetical protein